MEQETLKVFCWNYELILALLTTNTKLEILPYEMAKWSFFWFLKFPIPKLIIADPANDAIDGLLDSVNLSTYG